MPQPLISILAQPTGTQRDQAISSLVCQSYPNWELLIACDDVDAPNWARWAEIDRRMRIVAATRGQSGAARLNEASGHARGDWIGYFDPDADLRPDFLDRMIAACDSADVMISGFDVTISDVPGGQITQAWDPEEMRLQLFVRNIAKLFGVIHRRELLERTGGFHELLAGEEDWDLLKRFARAGAQFAFLKGKAGTLHVRNGSNSAHALTRWQQEQIDSNRGQGKPIFGARSGWMFPKKVERILFASVHCLLDYTNGASLAVLQAFRYLQKQGFQTDAFCLCDHMDSATQHLGAPSLQRPDAVIPPGMRGELDLEAEDCRGCGTSVVTNLAAPVREAARRDEYETAAAGIPVTVKPVEQNDPWQVTGETRKFLTVYERLLAEHRPDVIVTYGGDCLSMAMMEAAKFRDIPVVFWLHNFGYPSTASFQFVDRVLVPSEFSRDYHWNRLGLDCCAIPNFVDRQRVEVDHHELKYVTFVNPEAVKGGFIFAAIARDLATCRPDIPLLVVEGRSSTSKLKLVGLDLEQYPNVAIRPRTADPREFYAVSKLILMPSLWNESFGLVAAEAMINGIPVIASDRGALPEVIGDGGIVLDIPSHYTPETRDVPSAEEIEPWLTAIIRLWDDTATYQTISERARTRAKQWRPENIGPRLAEFFANVSPQPAAPIVPR